MAKDYTKYRFNEKNYSKSRLVQAVVAEWIKKNQPTLDELFNAFPPDLQGGKGVLITRNDYALTREKANDRYERFFNKEEDFLRIGDTEVLVSNQWRQANMPKFIGHSKKLGFEITSIESEVENQDILQEFLQHKPFAENYPLWSPDTIEGFYTLLKAAHDNGLDIFTTNMSSGGSIRLGRKDIAHDVAIEVFATLEPRKQGLLIEQRFQYKENPLKSELSKAFVDQLIKSGDFHQFSVKLPISRKANWPSDYQEPDINKAINIWKVSHSPNTFKDSDIAWLAEKQLLAVHKDTGNGSVPCFEKMKVGDVVSLGYGNRVFRLVRVTSTIITDLQNSPLGNNWLYRTYETIKGLDNPVKYNGKYKRWSPRFNGTCWYVPEHEKIMFQQEILEPYYQLTLVDIGAGVGEGNYLTEDIQGAEAICNAPMNQILFGPPGTGKTYRTVELAVRCADSDFIASGTTKSENRQSIKARFDQLLHEKRIRFVTFHQSYGYEEFVEGLSAKTEGDQLSYYEKNGVFKTICEDAKAYMGEKKEVYQVNFDELWQRFSDALAEETSGIEIKSLSEKTSFTITDISDSTIRFDKAQGTSVHSLSVKTLKAIYEEEKELTSGLKPYYGALIKYLKSTYESQAPLVSRERKNFVLVIDEINRGNISKIFGELITLIEPSKRLGQPEGLSVHLPYTGDSFGVPDNVFIIGTMNTADRSLALMDTALRRRFEFIEMMPDYSTLKDSNGNAHSIRSDEAVIDLVELLKTLNDRISALYDREHTLGHAFLMPVVEQIIKGDQEQALAELASAFKTKIIPLLAEYFFEDWQKIRLVIGDNQKESKGFDQIVTRSRMDIEGLFGESSELDTSSDSYAYSLADDGSDIWRDAFTYIGMYDASNLTGL
jgi:hypothetical protein